jgi:hypothetical protein
LRDEHDDENSGKAYKEAMLRSLSERPDIYDLLARSLAPSIYAMGDVKKGVLIRCPLTGVPPSTSPPCSYLLLSLQASCSNSSAELTSLLPRVVVAGVRATEETSTCYLSVTPAQGRVKSCRCIRVDWLTKKFPSSKTIVMQYVHKLAPRGVYTSGKSSSAVGLTAYVTRDPDSKQLVLERFVPRRLFL